MSVGEIGDLDGLTLYRIGSLFFIIVSSISIPRLEAMNVEYIFGTWS